MVHEKSESRRQSRQSATRERILVAAMEVLRQEGLEALTIQRLADVTDYAVGSLYRYFPAKGAVLAAVEARLITSIATDMAAAGKKCAAALGKRPRAADLALLDVLVAGHVYAAQEERRPVEFGLLARTLGDLRPWVDHADFADVRPELMRLLGQVGRLFAAASAAGALSPGSARERTAVFWGAVHGAMRVRKLKRFGLAGLGLDEVPVRTMHALLVAWGASPARLEVLDPKARRLVRGLPRAGARSTTPLP